MDRRTMPMESLAELILLQMEKGGSANLTVTGCSMYPMLYGRRDSVTLIPTQGKHKKGDVILYRRESGQYVLHRIIKVTETKYICSGDNQVMREPVTQAQVIAVVDGFTHRGKPYCMQSKGYRLYTWIWVEWFPLRKYYLFVRKQAGRFYRSIFKRKHK